MTTVNADDRELLDAYATRRDAEAFALLARRYAGMVYATARRVTGNAADAEDVTQSCFLELARSAGRVRSSVGGWLHAAAATRGTTLVMRASAQRKRERSRIVPEPATDVVWGQIECQVDDAIRRLPDDLRELLVSHYLQGVGQGELASREGVSQSTISRRIERAVELVREQLRRAGVEVDGSMLGAALAAGLPGGEAPEELVASVTKVGISGVGGAARTAAVGWALAGGVLLCVVVVAIGVMKMTTNSGVVQAGGGAIAGVQRPARVNLAGIVPGDRDTNPYAQGMSILFRHLGREDADYVRMMGYSGVAFALQVDLNGPIRDGKYDVAWWPNDFYAFRLRADFVGRAFGREVEWIDCDQGAYRENPQQAYQEAFEPAVVRAIDAGLPVLGQQDAAVLITGYDLERHRPIVVWPTPGQPAFGPPTDPIPWSIFVPGNAIAPLTQQQSELESLKWAITLWEERAAATAKGWDGAGILTGARAFAMWLEFLQQQKDGAGPGRDAWDNNMMIHLRYNQTAAVAYLRMLAARHPAVAETLNAAADLYEEALEDCNQAPFWGSTPPDLREEGLQEYTDIVRRTMQRHGEAIEQIRAAVRVMEKGV